MQEQPSAVARGSAEIAREHAVRELQPPERLPVDVRAGEAPEGAALDGRERIHAPREAAFVVAVDDRLLRAVQGLEQDAVRRRAALPRIVAGRRRMDARQEDNRETIVGNAFACAVDRPLCGCRRETRQRIVPCVRIDVQHVWIEPPLVAADIHHAIPEARKRRVPAYVGLVRHPVLDDASPARRRREPGLVPSRSVPAHEPGIGACHRIRLVRGFRLGLPPRPNQAVVEMDLVGRLVVHQVVVGAL